VTTPGRGLMSARIRQFRIVHSDGLRPVEVSVLIKGGHRYELRYSDVETSPA
jgi:hypothetical protein